MPLPQNTVLKNAILRKESSILSFCRRESMSYETVRHLIDLRVLPTVKGNKSKYRPICRRLSDALNKKVETLFPLEIYNPEYYAEQVNAALAAQPDAVDAEEVAASRASSPEEIYEIKKRIQTILSHISPRETMFLLKHRAFGKTFEEIAKEEGISHQRVGQIIRRAENKLKRVKA